MPILGGIAKKLTPPKIRLTLKLGKDYYALGENLEGELQLSSDEEVDVEEIRCELTCVEAVKTVRYVEARVGRLGSPVMVPTETWQSATLYSTKIVLSGPTHISKGFTDSYRFKVSIPITLKPTYKGVDRRVTWTIKGVAAVKNRPDATSMYSFIYSFRDSVRDS